MGKELVQHRQDSLVLTSTAFDILSVVTHDVGVVGKLIAASAALVGAARNLRMRSVRAVAEPNKRLSLVEQKLDAVVSGVQNLASQDGAFRAGIMLDAEEACRRTIGNAAAMREVELRYQVLLEQLSLQRSVVAFDMRQLKQEAVGATIKVEAARDAISGFNEIARDKATDLAFRSQAMEACRQAIHLLPILGHTGGRISAGLIDARMQIPDLIIAKSIHHPSVRR